MNPKKKSRRCRASVSIQALDLAISRFIHSLGYKQWIYPLTVQASTAGVILHSNEHIIETVLPQNGIKTLIFKY